MINQTATTSDINIFEYNINDQNKFELNVEIPLKLNFNEYFTNILNNNMNLFVKLNNKNDLKQKLNEFINEKTHFLHNKQLEARKKMINSSKKDELINYWMKLYEKNYVKTNEFNETVDECNDIGSGSNSVDGGDIDVDGDDCSKMFSKIYHKLIHSEFMQVILNKEREYMSKINDLIVERDKQLKYLEQKHAITIEDALKLNTSTLMPDSYISKLAKDHVESNELESSKWESKIINLKENQKREFKLWLIKLNNDENMRKTLLNEYLQQQQQQYQHKYNTNLILNDNDNKLQESYTIQLGAQLKTTHNLRLIKCDILDYCRSRFNLRVNFIEPQTIETAMCLYSNRLCACVLLVDSSLSKPNEISKKFINICEESTEFHFNTYEQQLASITDCLTRNGNESSLVAQATAAAIPPLDDDNEGVKLNIGDFYVTKHSNLSQAHIVFHLVCDDTVKQKSDISSRHPVILGLRNILKACCRYNITKLTLPLLLSHEMSEEMTINWVMKRAELVLKCLKGFMIEFVQLGGSTQESRTLQFVVPRHLMDETFHSLSNLIPSIFRESRTVNLS